MTLESVSERLSELADAESGLRRSRAMAQLWHEVRQASTDERRILAHALADRFAPALVERFQSVAGVDGPEFIKLVRDLIDLDGEDIRSVIADLSGISADIEAPTAPATGDEEGSAEARDDLLDVIFDEISAAADPASGDGLDQSEVDPDALDQAVRALEQLPDTSPVPSAFDLAQGRFRDLEETPNASKPSQRRRRSPSPPPQSRHGHRPPDPDLRTVRVSHAGGDLAGRLARMPDGWKRRRMLSAAIRSGEVDVPAALELGDTLASRVDRGWIVGDLIEQGLTRDERELLRQRELPGAPRSAPRPNRVIG